MYKIMVVDDDKYILATIKRTLKRKQEWQVETISNPVEALEQASHTQYDLFMSDYQMPGINGIELLSRLRTLQPDAMRIILSGDDSRAVKDRAVSEAGIYNFIVKPAKAAELVSTIERAHQLHHIREQNQKLRNLIREREAWLNHERPLTDA